jgi:hypothetical protein
VRYMMGMVLAMGRAVMLGHQSTSPVRPLLAVYRGPPIFCELGLPAPPHSAPLLARAPFTHVCNAGGTRATLGP